MLDWKNAEAPDFADIEELAREAIAALPPEFTGPAAQVVLRVADFAPEEFLDELEIDDPLELTGLYDGVPLTEKSPSDPQHSPIRSGCFAAPSWTNGPAGAMSPCPNWSGTWWCMNSPITSAGPTTISRP